MIDQQIQKQFIDGRTWVQREFVDPHDGLLYAIRESGENRPIFVESLRRRLGSTDLRQRTGAIALLGEILPDIGADTALEALLTTPLDAGVKPAWRIVHADLKQCAAVALARQVTQKDTVTLAWLKKLAKSRIYNNFLLSDIARLDPDWILANAEIINHNNLKVLTSIPHSRRGELIAALAPWPTEPQSPSADYFWKQLPPEEADRLQTLIRKHQRRQVETEPTASFTYTAGNPNAPDDPIGQETLAVYPDGRFNYTRIRQGQSVNRNGQVDASVFASIKSNLSIAAFPDFPSHNLLPGASLVTIEMNGESIAVDFFQVRQLDGYAPLIQLCDAWLNWLRDPSHPATLPDELTSD